MTYLVTTYFLYLKSHSSRNLEQMTTLAKLNLKDSQIWQI